VNLGAAAGLAFDPLTGTAYLADGAEGATASLYTLDIGTGFATLIGSTAAPVGIAGLTFIGVPEPSSIFMAGLGVFAMRCFLRRKGPFPTIKKS